MAEENELIWINKKQLPEILLGLLKEGEAVEIYGSFWPVTKRAKNSLMEQYLALTEKYNKDRYDLLERDDLTQGEIDGVERIIKQDLRREEKLRGLKFYLSAFDYEIASVYLIILQDNINLVNGLSGLAAYEGDEGSILKIAAPNWQYSDWSFEFNEFHKKEKVMLHRGDVLIANSPHKKLKSIL